MPARKRAQERKRRRPVVLPWQAVPPVGSRVQAEDAWADRVCPVCQSVQCKSHDAERR